MKGVLTQFSVLMTLWYDALSIAKTISRLVLIYILRNINKVPS